MITKRPNNWRRELIIKNNLIAYLDNINISDKNKSIVRDYVSGLSYKEVGEKYNISSSRVEEVLATFFYHLNKNGLYSFTKDPFYFDLMMKKILDDMKAENSKK